MGLIQRIFYFHVAFFCWCGLHRLFHQQCRRQHRLILRSRTPKWDWLAVSSAEVGVPFVTVMLVTGPIRAHPVWGIWWTAGMRG